MSFLCGLRAGLAGGGRRRAVAVVVGCLCGLAVGGRGRRLGTAFAVPHIYWSIRVVFTIGEASLDGTGVNQSFITGANSPEGPAVSVPVAHVGSTELPPFATHRISWSAPGARGAAGKLELITCKTVTTTVTETIKGKRRKVRVKRQKCTGKLVSGKVKFTIEAPPHTRRSPASATFTQPG